MLHRRRYVALLAQRVHAVAVRGDWTLDRSAADQPAGARRCDAPRPARSRSSHVPREPLVANYHVVAVSE